MSCDSVCFDPRPIGVFDSGLGGLTVVSAIRALLPAEDVIYLGDTARVPYGNRSAETVTAFAVQDFEFLQKLGVKTVIAACNTVSSVALDTLHAHACGIPVSGVILPGVRAAAARKKRSAAVIGTRGTIQSGAYERALLTLDSSIRIRSVACPLLVPLAEEGILEGPVVREILHMYLEQFRVDPPDILLPGCTHYPLFHKALREFLPPSVFIVDCAGACAAELGRELFATGHSAPPDRAGHVRFFVTDFPRGFETQACRFLGDSPVAAEKAVL